MELKDLKAANLVCNNEWVIENLKLAVYRTQRWAKRTNKKIKINPFKILGINR